MNAGYTSVPQRSAADKRSQLARLLEERNSKSRIYRLSPAQASLWTLYQQDGCRRAYQLAGAIHLTGDVDIDVLESAIGELANRHEILRTRIEVRSGEPVQVVEPGGNFRLARRDGLNWTQILAEDGLFRATLVQLGRRETALVLVLDHMACDGWSVGVLLRQLSDLYRQPGGRSTDEMSGVTISYGEYSEWQHRWLEGAEAADQLKYWTENLRGAPRIALPFCAAAPGQSSWAGRSHHFVCPGDLKSRLQKLGQQNGVTLFMTLFAAFAVTLAQYTGQHDLVIGTVVANRRRHELADMVGMLANTLALRIAMNPSWRWSRLMDHILQVVVDGFARQEIPFERVVRAVRTDQTPVVETLFAFQNTDPWQVVLSGRDCKIEEFDTETAKFDLSLLVAESGDELKGRLEYRCDRVDATMAESLLKHWLRILREVTSEIRISELTACSEPERAGWLLACSGPEQPVQGRTVGEMFAAQAQRSPHAVALVCGEERQSYRQINEAANRLAHVLQRRGVCAEQLVGICLGRSERLVAALLAVWKAGAAYVPLEPIAPPARLRALAQSGGIRLVICESRHRERWSGSDVEVLDLDELAEELASSSVENPRAKSQPANLSHVLFTSGSTGVPKGVMIEHRQAVGLLEWAHHTYTAEELDGVVAGSALSFDLSIFELFAPLTAGGKVILVDSVMALEGAARRGEAHLLNTVPTAIAELVRNGKLPAGIRVANLAGERLSVSLVDEIYASGKVGRVVDLYGPTETTTYSSYGPRTAGETVASIGRAISNVQIYVLNEDLQPAPALAVGEIWIGGQGVTRGYLGQPGLTAERYRPDPYGSEAGGRMYGTGDRGRYGAGGRLEYLGRQDRQVKLRGYRVELDEIEAVLRKAAGVRECAVGVLPGDSGGRLVAWLAAEGEAEQWRSWVEQHLPGYMVPAHWVRLPALPRSRSGKLDYQALPAPALNGGKAEAPPRTPREQLVASVWREFLGVEQPGVDDNFFHAGGHSLLAMRLLSRLEYVTGLSLDLAKFFQHPTISALASQLERAQAPAPRPATSRNVEVAAYPLSATQEGLWFLERMQGGRRAHQIAGVIEIKGPLNIDALEQSLAGIVSKHNILRTQVELRSNVPMNIVTPAASWRLHRATAPDMEVLLEGDSFFRAGLSGLDGHHLLMFAADHMAADGWSLGLLFRELSRRYASIAAGHCDSGAAVNILENPLPSYAQYVEWQKNWLRSEPAKHQLRYWIRKLEGVSRLELAQPHRSVAGWEGGSEYVDISDQLRQRLKEVSERSGTTLFMTLLTAFAAVIAARSSQREFVIGTVVANRRHEEWVQIIGMFANTVALRISVDTERSWSRLLQHIRVLCIEAFENQELPFEQVVKAVCGQDHANRMPLVQVLFVLQDRDMFEMRLPALDATVREADTSTSKFELSVLAVERGDAIAARLEYNKSAFDQEEVRSLAQQWVLALEAVAADAEAKIAETTAKISTHTQPARSDSAMDRVKIRLLGHPAVEDCAVLRSDPAAGSGRLIAYVVLTRHGITAELKNEIGADIDLVEIARMPLNRFGRIDEQQLRGMRASQPEHPREAACSALPKSLSNDSGIPIGRSAAPPRLAIADGGPFSLSLDRPHTLAAALRDTAEKRGDAGITFAGGERGEFFQNYRTLYRNALHLAGGLQQSGFATGTPVILQITDTCDLLTAFWACIIAGAPPLIVAIPPSYEREGSILDKLLHAWSKLGRPAILASADLAARISLPNVMPLDRISQAAPKAVETDPDETALFQLTSGSTGASKCILETHRGIISHIQASAAFNRFSSDDVSLNWLPFDHVVPLITFHIKDVYLGCSQVQSTTRSILAEPLLWLDLMERFGVTHSWSPNFGYRLVGEAIRDCDRTWDLSSVCMLMNAGEQVTPDVVRRFLSGLEASKLRESAMRPAFGMAELSTCVTYAKDFSVSYGCRRFERPEPGQPLRETSENRDGSLELVDLGPPAPGTQLRIVDEQDRPLAENTIGRLQARGASLMPGYFDDEEANRAAFTTDGWFDTGDLGFLQYGRLTVTGRAKEIIIINGVHYASHEIEEHASRAPGIDPGLVAACGFTAGSGAEQLALFLVVTAGSGFPEEAVLQAASANIAQHFGIRPAVAIAIGRDEFPRTTSGKIQRHQLRQALERGEFSGRTQAKSEQGSASRIFRSACFESVWVPRLLSAPDRDLDGLRIGILGDSPWAEKVKEELQQRGAGLFDAAAADELLVCGAGPQVVFEVARLAKNRNSMTSAPRRIMFVTENAFAIFPDEHFDTRAALLPGLIKTFRLEFPQYLCRHLDLPAGDADSEKASRVLRELRSASRDPEIGYRGGARLQSRLGKVTTAARQANDLPFQKGGLYLISGGCGAVGSRIAQYLLAEWDARLLIIGRAPAEARSRTLRELEACGGEVCYASADVTDTDSLQRAMLEARQRWQIPLRGALHLAAEREELPLASETAAHCYQSVSSKVNGAMLLFDLVKRERGDVFIAFSSVNGLFGGREAGAYSAANSCLESYFRSIELDASVQTYCIHWSAWDSANSPIPTERKSALQLCGYQVIQEREGIRLFIDALKLGPGRWIVGLDETHAAIRRMCATGNDALHSGQPSVLEADCDPGLIDRIRKTWQQVLHRDQIGVHENFFDAGGDSILAARLHAGLEREFGRELSVVDVLNYSSIAAMAGFLQASPIADPAIERAKARAARRRTEGARTRSADGGAS